MAACEKIDRPVWVDTAPSRVLKAAGQLRFRVHRG
jgi:hypothetical protein